MRTNKNIGVWIGLILLVYGCAVDIQERNEFSYPFEGNSSTPLVLYITNPNSKRDRDYTYHIRKTLNYTKIPFQQTNISIFNQKPVIATTTQVVVLLNTKPLEVQAMETLVSFAANGGTIILLNYSEDLNFSYLAGLKNNPVFSTNATASGFRFSGDFLPTMKGKRYETEFNHYGLERDNFSDKVNILATAVNNPLYPAIIENRIMDGKVLVFNNSIACQKIDRGLYFAAILRGLPKYSLSYSKCRRTLFR